MKIDEKITQEQVLQPADTQLEQTLFASDHLPPATANHIQFMEELVHIKREKEQRSKEQRFLFFNIGMTVSLLLVTLIINWEFKGDQDLVDLGQLAADVEEIIEIPISKQPPPPPPQKVPEAFVIEAVSDEELVEDLDIDLDVEISVNDETTQYEYIAPDVEEVQEEVVEEVFTVVETFPEPVGGYDAFNRYVAESLRYPKAASRLNVSGRVFVKFVVEKDGSLTDAVVVKGIGAGCDEEALRVINNAPKWNPGKQRGQPVRVSRIIPIRFVLMTN